MEPRFALPILLSLGAGILVPAAAHADAWDNLQVVCKELHIPQIDQFVKVGRAWEAKEVGAQGDLGNLAHNVCPAYLQNPNAVASVGAEAPKGSVSLQQYVAEQSRTFSNALEADAKGNTSEAYLMAQYTDLAKACARAQVNFANTLCGKYVTERYTFIKSELAKIKEKTADVQKTCAQLAGKISDEAKLNRAPTVPLGQSSAAPVRAPAGTSTPGQSTITGAIEPK